MKNLIIISTILFFASCNHNTENKKEKENLPTTTQKLEVVKIDSANIQLEKVKNNFIDDLIFKIDSTEDETKILTIYRNKSKLLTHLINKRDGDCSSINIELGNYKIIENGIVFYTYWAAADRMGMNLMPFGFRKQIYEIDETGKLIAKKSKIYIENNIDKNNSNKEYYDENNLYKHNGVKLLNVKPKSNYEVGAKNDYIKNIEKEYNSIFVLNNEKKLLETEVRNELKKEISINTNDWNDKEIWGVTNK